MNATNILLISAGIAAIYVSFYYLDAKHHFRFVDWMNGRCDNPLSKKYGVGNNGYQANLGSAALNKKDQEIAALKERVAVLEKLVTEPAYELNKKLNQL